MIFTKYFYIVFLLVFFTGAVGLFGAFWFKIKKDFTLKMLSRKILTQQKNISGPIYFSSFELKKHVKDVNGQPDIDDDGYELFFHPEKAIKKTQKNPVLTAELYFLLGKKAKARDLLEQTKTAGLHRFMKAKKLFLEAAFALEEGDLMAASEDCAKATVLFRKEKAFYEVAEAHLLMGTIYRISALYDVAQMMFKTAADMFEQFGAVHRKAEAIGNRGMLTAAQELFDDAEAYFLEAQDIYASLKQKVAHSQIINQRALTFLAAGNHKKADELIKQARFNGKGQQYNVFAGFNYELDSRNLSAQKKWKPAFTAAEKAFDFYTKTKNIPGQLETLMLQAQAAFELKKPKQAETFARQAIALSEKNASCFHIANAYSLLGLIFLQQGDLPRAKTFFMQSLSQETRNDRRNGMAIDCANLALLEKLSGHQNEADDFAQKALEYAQAFGEDDLYQLLKNKSLS